LSACQNQSECVLNDRACSWRYPLQHVLLRLATPIPHGCIGEHLQFRASVIQVSVLVLLLLNPKNLDAA
jgi:hypothetical protein